MMGTFIRMDTTAVPPDLSNPEGYQWCGLCGYYHPKDKSCHDAFDVALYDAAHQIGTGKGLTQKCYRCGEMHGSAYACAEFACRLRNADTVKRRIATSQNALRDAAMSGERHYGSIDRLRLKPETASGAVR